MVPFAISIAVLAWLSARLKIAPADVLASISARELALLALALSVYGAFGLWVESLSLIKALSGRGQLDGMRSAVRIKAASYLAFIVHYTLGMGAQTYLLRKRAGVELWFAMGIVTMLSTLDLVGLLLAAGVASLLASQPPVAAGIPLAIGLGSLGLILLLRFDVATGPLARLRETRAVAAMSACPPRDFAWTVGLRFALMSSYFAFAAATIAIFGIPASMADSISKMTLVALVAAIPVAAAGLGTSQAAFLLLFSGYAPPEKLLACSLAMTLGLITLRVGLGLVFAREYALESLEAQEEISI